MSRSHSKRKKMDLLKTLLDDEDSDQNRRSRIGLSPPRHSDRILSQRYQELQDLLLNQYVQSQALLQQQFFEVQQRSAEMQRTEAHRFPSDDDYGGRLRQRRAKSARSSRRYREDPTRPMTATGSHRSAPQVEKTGYSDDDFEDIDDVEEAVLLRTYPEPSRHRASSSFSSSVDSQSDDGSDWDDPGSHGDKRVSFSGIVDGMSRDFDSLGNSRQRKGILKYSSPRRKIMYTYPGYTQKSRADQASDEVRQATTLLSMLHLPTTRFGLQTYDPTLDQSNRRVVKLQRQKFKRKNKVPPPPISLSPQVSPRSSLSSRSPREIKLTENHLGKSNNPELLKWLRKKNAMLRKQKKEHRKEEREKKKVEQSETEKKIERVVEAEELYDKWLRKKSKDTLLVRREEKKRREYQEALKEQERIERDKRLAELKAKEKEAMKMKKRKTFKSKTKPSEDGSEEKDKAAENKKVDDEKKEESDKNQKKEDNSNNTTKKPKKKGKNKVHPVLTGLASRNKTVRDPDGTLASNNDYVYTRPGRPKSATQNNQPSLSRFQPKRKPNPMSKMSYDEWIKHKRKEENRKKLAEEVKQAKDAWSDPTLQNIIPKLARERIEKATESKLKVDSGLKKSPRESRSPSPEKGQRSPSPSVKIPTGDKVNNDNGNGTEHQPRPPTSKARPGSTNGKVPSRPGSANGKPPTPPLSQRPGSGGRKARQKIQQTERPEPQGCEIPTEQSQVHSAEENDGPVNQQSEEDNAKVVQDDQSSQSKDQTLDKDGGDKDGVNKTDQQQQPETETDTKDNKKDDSQSASREEKPGETVESSSGTKESNQSETPDDNQTGVKNDGNQSASKDDDTTEEKQDKLDIEKENAEVEEEQSERKTKVKFNLDENVNIPPPETEADAKQDEVYKTANLIDDFLRKDSDEQSKNDIPAGEGAVDGKDEKQEATSVFMTESTT
ncbi:uncharacterized protein LOC144448236 [Glandiceps talaboti]